jgi:hypothetical protein
MVKKILEQKYQAEVADLPQALGDLSQVLGESAAMPLRLSALWQRESLFDGRGLLRV